MSYADNSNEMSLFFSKNEKKKSNKKINKIKVCCSCTITKTCLYNFDLLKPHFYIVKLGLTGVHIIFLISAQNVDCGYFLELSH